MLVSNLCVFTVDVVELFSSYEKTQPKVDDRLFFSFLTSAAFGELASQYKLLRSV
jgi:hypothetical protein